MTVYLLIDYDYVLNVYATEQLALTALDMARENRQYPEQLYVEPYKVKDEI